MFPCYSNASLTRRLSKALAEGLRQELDLTPKPGLVDLSNSGSHEDLSYGLMARSIDLLEGYFVACASALESGAEIETLRELGKTAEQAMLQRFGTNTHRGAIFLGGLLLAGVHAAGKPDGAATSAAVAAQAKRLFGKQTPTDTLGAQVRKRFKAGGVVTEALAGLPCVFELGVPALRRGIALGMTHRNALLLAMALLMQYAEDTTALRRCGTLGLAQVRADGRRLEELLMEGRTPDRFLRRADHRYRSRRLTMGGVADLLGICIAWYLVRERSPVGWGSPLETLPTGNATRGAFHAR